MSKFHIFFETPEMVTDDDKNSLLLLGIADDGPVYQMYKIHSYEELKKTFGNSSMEEAYISLPYIDSYSVYAMRVNGSSAFADVIPDVLTIHSYKAGSQYNSRLAVAIKNGKLQLLDNNKVVVEYDLSNYLTISQLTEKINQDCSYRLHDFVAINRSMNAIPVERLGMSNIIKLENGYDYEYTSNSVFHTHIINIESTENVITITFNNFIKESSVKKELFGYNGIANIQNVTHSGDSIIIELDDFIDQKDVLEIKDGLRDDFANFLPPYRLEYQEGWHECKSLKELYKEAYNDYLYNVNIKTIAVTGIYYGNSVDYISDLAQYCYRMNQMGYPLMGVMSAYRKGEESLENYVTNLQYMRHNLTIDEAGAYVNVIAGEGYIREQACTLEGALAGLLCFYDNNESITNKELFEGRLSYDFREFSIKNMKYLDRLVAANINCPYISVGRGICLYFATTMAENSFRYTKYARIAQEIVARVSRATSIEVGENISSISVLSIDNITLNTLRQMVTEEYMQSFEYTIEEHNLSDLLINISFVPVGDIENLTVSVII